LLVYAWVSVQWGDVQGWNPAKKHPVSACFGGVADKTSRKGNARATDLRKPFFSPCFGGWPPKQGEKEFRGGQSSPHHLDITQALEQAHLRLTTELVIVQSQKAFANSKKGITNANHS